MSTVLYFVFLPHFLLHGQPYTFDNPGDFFGWQNSMADFLNTLPGVQHRHVLSQNIDNLGRRITNPHAGINYFSFHYMVPQCMSVMNPHFPLPIGTEETGFMGTADQPYRVQAWLTMLSGASSYSMLDYSFSVLSPSGHDLPLPANAPGGGSPALRQSLGFLAGLLAQLDLQTTQPKASLVAGVNACSIATYELQYAALADSGSARPAALIYVAGFASSGSCNVRLGLQLGAAGSRWLVTGYDPVSTAVLTSSTVGCDSTGTAWVQFTADQDLAVLAVPARD